MRRRLLLLPLVSALALPCARPHLRDNGRITLMFCAFVERPRIVRLAGRGTFVAPGDDRYDDLAPQFPDHPGARAVITVDVERIADSCGFAVPNYEFVADRDVLTRWSARHTPEELDAYRRENNALSIDGLGAGLVADVQLHI